MSCCGVIMLYIDINNNSMSNDISDKSGNRGSFTNKDDCYCSNHTSRDSVSSSSSGSTNSNNNNKCILAKYNDNSNNNSKINNKNIRNDCNNNKNSTKNNSDNINSASSNIQYKDIMNRSKNYYFSSKNFLTLSYFIHIIILILFSNTIPQTASFPLQKLKLNNKILKPSNKKLFSASISTTVSIATSSNILSTTNTSTTDIIRNNIRNSIQNIIYPVEQENVDSESSINNGDGNNDSNDYSNYTNDNNDNRNKYRGNNDIMQSSIQKNTTQKSSRDNGIQSSSSGSSSSRDQSVLPTSTTAAYKTPTSATPTATTPTSATPTLYRIPQGYEHRRVLIVGDGDMSFAAALSNMHICARWVGAVHIYIVYI